jgi:hypothetical protein
MGCGAAAGQTPPFLAMPECRRSFDHTALSRLPKAASMQFRVRVVAVNFRNCLWALDRRYRTTAIFADTELDERVSYAGIAPVCG